MSRSVLQRVVLVAALLLAAGAVPDAAAQFGKLKKILKDNGPCVPDRPPTIVETVTLTAAQMAAVNAGLDAEIQAAPAAFDEADKHQKENERLAKEYEKSRADYDKSKQKYDACVGKFEEADNARSEALNQKSDAASQAAGQVDKDELVQLAERAQAAADRVSKGVGTAEDRRTMAEFQQKMAGIKTGGDAAIAAHQESSEFERQRAARLETACGKAPVEPVPPAGSELPGQNIRNAGAKAAKMSERDYAAGREDLLALAMGNAVVKGSGKGSQQDGAGKGSGKPSDAEADAMNQQIKETAKKVCEMKKAKVPLF